MGQLEDYQSTELFVATRDGKKLVTYRAGNTNPNFPDGNYPSQLKVWDFQSGKLLRSIKVNGTCYRGLIIDPTGKYAASPVDIKRGRVTTFVTYVWDLNTGQTVAKFDNIVSDICFSSDGQFLLGKGVPLQLGIVEVVNVSNWMPQVSITLGSFAAFGPELALLQSSPVDNTTLIERWTSSIKIGANGKRVLHRTATLQIRNNESGELIRKHIFKEGLLSGVTYSPDGELLALATTEGKFQVYQAKDFSRVSTFTDPKKVEKNIRYYKKLSFSPDKRFISAEIMLLKSGRPKPEVIRADGSGSLQIDFELYAQVSFLPNGILGVTRSGKPIRFFDPETGRELRFPFAKQESK